MTFEHFDQCFELLHVNLPIGILLIVPLLMTMSPVFVNGSYDIPVYRMQQFDLHGSIYGTRNSVVNYEARTIQSAVKTRRCILSLLNDITTEKIKDLIQHNAGGLLIILPVTMTDVEVQHLQELEQELSYMEISIPVYVTYDDVAIRNIYNDAHSSSSDSAGSAAEALLYAASGSGYHLVISGAQGTAIPDFSVSNIQGRLAGLGVEDSLPTIAVVAHYDAFGIAPELAFGSDSNGSGVVALLELARIFSKLYAYSRTHAKFNIIFLLTGGGKFNFQGTKRWIEEYLENSESSGLMDIRHVICLDSLAKDNALFVHVSKPPKPGTTGAVLFENLKSSVNVINNKKEQNVKVEFDLKHKKINLADEYLAWEHERFSIKRIPSFTLSHYYNHENSSRRSITDTRKNSDVKILKRNIDIIAEAMAQYIYDVQDFSISIIKNMTDEEFIKGTLDQLTSVPRSAQLVGKDTWVIRLMANIMEKYLKDVKILSVVADKKDPDFLFYSGTKYTTNAYKVKPAVFDLFLAISIALYLALVFFSIQHFDKFLNFVRSFKTTSKTKAN